MFVQAQVGDSIIVLEVSRLARSTQQLCEIIETVRESICVWSLWAPSHWTAGTDRPTL